MLRERHWKFDVLGLVFSVYGYFLYLVFVLVRIFGVSLSLFLGLGGGGGGPPKCRGRSFSFCHPLRCPSPRVGITSCGGFEGV